METPQLVSQDCSDADELIEQRIESIHKCFRGGLSEFFEQLKTQREQRSLSYSPIDKSIELRLKQAAFCGNPSSGADD